ncbi:MAG: aminotransferase [Pseudomonadota bacterium]
MCVAVDGEQHRRSEKATGMMRPLNPVFWDRPKSIFPTMSALARAHGAINLGQGFPDEDGPREILHLAADALLEGPNQYVPVEGVKALRDAVAAANHRFYGIDVDPDKEVLVVSGATEGLAAAFLGLLSPGDEAVIFAPFYECYAPQIEAAGARPRAVNLTPPTFRINRAVLEAAITPATKMIVVNTPHNPLGRVISREECALIAEIAQARDLIVLCDEVYEHLIFDGLRHEPLMAAPGMFERTIRIGSAGKTFSMTGWRIGYATGPERLITGMMKAHQHLAYTSPGHLQAAVAAGLALGDAYYRGFVADMQEKRDIFVAALQRAGFETLPCEGTYFITVDIRSVGRDDDAAFCREITERAKVAAVPLSAFYLPDADDAPRVFARFCFCKKPSVLEEAASRLAAYFGSG